MQSRRISRRFICLVVAVLLSSPMAAMSDPTGSTDRPGADVFDRSETRPTRIMLAAKPAEALPTSRDSLFDDDEPATAADQPPARRESLFVDDQPSSPQATDSSRQSSARAAGLKGFIQNVMAYDWPKPRHWSEMMTRVDLSTQGDLGSQVKWKLGARVDYDATYTFTD